MAGLIAKILFKESLENKFGSEDPYFETVPATRLGGKPKRKRKANPPGLSDHDGKVLTKVKRRAYRLDMCLFNCCGIRFGWSSVIGIIPAIGDVLDMLMALLVLRTCTSIDGGLPTSIKAKMIFNIGLDFAVGLVPLLGDLADAVFRANTRNAVILERYLREKGKRNLRASGAPLPAADPSDPAEYDRMEGDSSGIVSSQPASGDERIMTLPTSAKVEDKRIGRASSVPRNQLRDMEEGKAPQHSGSGSKKKATASSRNGQSSRRGR